MGFENAGDLLLAEGRAAEAGPLLQQAIALHEAARSQVSAELLGGLLSARTQLCDWQDRDALLARVLHAPGSPPNIFELLWQPVAPARLKRAAEAHAASLRPPPAPPLLRAAGTDRLRVGYLSADFHQHATAYLIAEVLERHDRARFDILAYSTGPDDGSAMRARLAAAVGHFHDCAALPDRALAERIAADGLDLLVDLKGWTRDGRVQALAYRPAPLQASWLGFPGTLGADWIDYAIVDSILAPPGSEAQFTESLLRLPHCYQPNDRQRAIGDTPGRAEAGLPEHALVLACFCQAAKITPAVFAAWMRALAALPDAVLWLLQPLPAAAANLQREAAARGIDPARILFAPKLPLDRHLARYRLVDLALDTTPYGSHTTASDALWAGCPQLAITGDSFAARVSTSIVAAAGVPELAAPDLPTHEAMILRLGRDATARAALRAKLAAARHIAPLWDTPRFVQHLEAGYAAVIARQREGLAPAMIDIPA